LAHTASPNIWFQSDMAHKTTETTGELVEKVQQALKNTRRLLEDAQQVHETADAAHRKARELHSKLRAGIAVLHQRRVPEGGGPS
jgi:prophage DNA circulation protein